MEINRVNQSYNQPQASSAPKENKEETAAGFNTEDTFVKSSVNDEDLSLMKGARFSQYDAYRWQ